MKYENRYFSPNASTIEPELAELQIVAEFNAWEATSDEALENFEKFSQLANVPIKEPHTMQPKLF